MNNPEGLRDALNDLVGGSLDSVENVAPHACALLAGDDACTKRTDDAVLRAAPGDCPRTKPHRRHGRPGDPLLAAFKIGWRKAEGRIDHGLP